MSGTAPARRRPEGGAWAWAWLWRVGRAVAARPDLWLVALVQLRRLTPNRWWRRWPPVPVPDRAWIRFRLQTAYGDPEHAPPPEDVVAWLEWCRQWKRLRYPSRP